METVERNGIKCPNCGCTSRDEEKWWALTERGNIWKSTAIEPSFKNRKNAKKATECWGCNSNGGCGVVITTDNKVHFHQRPIPELTLCVELGEVLV